MKGSEEVILTESVLDALTLWRAGIRHVSCVYGTQGFTDDHAELLERFRVRRVLLWLDNDEAGDQATAALAEGIAKLGIDVVDARVEGAKDPNELLRSLGAEAFQKRIATSLPLTVKTTAKEENVGDRRPRVTPEPGGGRRIAFAERTYRVRGLTAGGLDRLRVNLRVEGSGRAHLDTLDLYGHRARAGLVKELGRLFGEDEATLAREIADLIETLEGLRQELAKDGPEGTTPGRIEIPDRERREALELLRAPDLIERILGDFERVGCVGERTALTMGYLGTVSRLLDDPLGLIIVSRAGAGKSSLQDALCDFVPAEDLVRYTRLTGQALFYKEEDSLAHKVLAVDEETGAEEAAYSIRTLQSAQVLSVASTRADPQTGGCARRNTASEGRSSSCLPRPRPSRWTTRRETASSRSGSTSRPSRRGGS
jgi:hypothetical protein